MEPARELQKGLSPQPEFFLARGMDSFTDPTFVGARQYRAGFNVVNRGGLVQCRPGYRSLASLPAGRLQGLTLFTPTGGKPHLVAAVDGAVYSAKAPFTTFYQIPRLQFRKGVRNIYFADTLKVVNRNTNGSLTVCDPYRVLVIQDGNHTRAGYWDGANSGHLDPSPAVRQTIGGGVMCWSGDRLWVAKGPQLFASDIGDPLSFDENEYLAEGQPLLFPSDITAMVEIPSIGTPTLLVFTKNGGYMVRSDIRDRTKWKTTDDFQTSATPVGCSGHRAVAVQYGLVWWYSPGGLISLDSGALSNASSQVHYRDVEMAISKANIARFTERVAMAAVENFLLVSVPSGSGYNRHTWVMDQSAADLQASDLAPAWAGIWTGTQPVEWAVGEVGGRLRAFFASVDFDGVNRVWEAFQPSQHDDDKKIDWSIVTKAHAEGLGLSDFRFAEVFVAQCRGQVALSVDYAGPYRGAWKNLLDVTVRARTGGLTPTTALVGATAPLVSLRPQVRRLCTSDASSNPGASGPEGATNERTDYSHQIRISGSGPAAIRGYKMYCQPFKETGTAQVSTTETAETAIDLLGIDQSATSVGSLTAVVDHRGGPFLVSPLELRAEDSDYSSV